MPAVCAMLSGRPAIAASRSSTAGTSYILLFTPHPLTPSPPHLLTPSPRFNRRATTPPPPAPPPTLAQAQARRGHQQTPAAVG